MLVLLSFVLVLWGLSGPLEVFGVTVLAYVINAARYVYAKTVRTK